MNEVVRQIGALLGRLHSVPIDGCGRKLTGDTWEHPNWRQWLEREIQSRQAAKPYLLQAGFSSADIRLDAVSHAWGG